jgi:hypothetical protein
MRRKHKAVHKHSAGDDKKLQSTLKKLQVNPIPSIEEVNMFKDDGAVIHFKNPKGIFLLLLLFPVVVFNQCGGFADWSCQRYARLDALWRSTCGEPHSVVPQHIASRQHVVPSMVRPRGGEGAALFRGFIPTQWHRLPASPHHVIARLLVQGSSFITGNAISQAVAVSAVWWSPWQPWWPRTWIFLGAADFLSRSIFLSSF